MNTTNKSPDTYDEAIEKQLRREAVTSLKAHGIGHPVSTAACQAWRDHAELRVDTEARESQSAIITFTIDRAKMLGEAELYEDALAELDDARRMAIQHNEEELLARIEKGMEIFENLLDEQQAQ